MLVAAGSRHEEPFEGGAARLTALLLTSGTASRSAEQYTKEVEALGATVAGDATRDFATPRARSAPPISLPGWT